jgi:hypothetical protein
MTEMRARQRSLDVGDVPDQGRAPLLFERDIIERIAQFVARCEKIGQS